MSVKLVNNQPHTGLFGVPSFPVMEGDTVATLAKRLHRMERNVKDHERVSIFRFTDPVMGPRKIPSLTAPLEGKTEVSKLEDWTIDSGVVQTDENVLRFKVHVGNVFGSQKF